MDIGFLPKKEHGEKDGEKRDCILESIHIREWHAPQSIEQKHHSAEREHYTHPVIGQLPSGGQTDPLALYDWDEDDHCDEIAEKHQLECWDLPRQFADHSAGNGTNKCRHTHPEDAGGGPDFEHLWSVFLNTFRQLSRNIPGAGRRLLVIFHPLAECYSFEILWESRCCNCLGLIRRGRGSPAIFDDRKTG